MKIPKPVKKVKVNISDCLAKACTKCGEIKEYNRFCVDKSHKDGLGANCKDCVSEKNKKYYILNSKKIKDASKKYRLENPEKTKLDGQVWRKNNKEKARFSENRWRIKHPENVKATNKKSAAKKLSTPAGKLNNNIAGAIRYSLNNNSKAGQHWETLVGYKVEELKTHLEKQFLSGMTWKNYGQWHIDHKIPIVAFNIESPVCIDFKKCWALPNLQPLWKLDNILKKDKLLKPFQPSLLMEVPD